MEDLHTFEILPFDRPSRELFKSLGNVTIRQIGGSNDAKIACIAVINNLTVVTHNTKDFKILRDKIGVQFEDWTV